jgi:putative tricarboxylic transport membrane protein
MIAFALGALAFGLRRFHFPLPPVLLGLVIGPLFEQELRRSLAISGGAATIFFTRPIAATLVAVTAVMIVWPLIARRRRPVILDE